MWARKCGAPALWPSRVKVCLMSLFSATVGLALYQFMAGADVGYLDLHAPVDSEILCLSQWPMRGESTKIFDTDSWRDWFYYKSDVATYIEEHHCVAPSAVNGSCAQVNVPLNDIKRRLGVSMSPSQRHSSDVLMVYAYVFLVLCACLWLATNCHDLTLLSNRKKDYILDLSGIINTYRSIRTAFDVLGFCLYPALFRSRSRSGMICAVVASVFVIPIQIAWSIVAFVFVSCPVISVVFICHPLRTSRLWAFILCVMVSLFGLVLTLHQLAFLADGATRAQFAVTWQVPSAGSQANSDCICGCNFRVSAGTCTNLIVIGIGTTAKAIFLAVRCLKGLRRSNWANLLTVTFAVPLTAYSVEWTQPDGKPIRGRQEGQPVQSELAFDPFALMDEQPESASTTMNLQPVPVPVPSLGSSPTRSLDGPMIPKTLKSAARLQDLAHKEYIGCCGFPCRTGGMQVTLELDEDPEDASVDEGRPSPTVAIQEKEDNAGGEDTAGARDPELGISLQSI